MNIIEYGSHCRFIGAGNHQENGIHQIFHIDRQMLYQCQKKQKKRQEGQYDKVGRLAGVGGKTVFSDFF